jgi:transposase InsO family protein
MLDWHRAHGENVALTARHFGFSRPTVYRWLARYERLRLESLEDRPSRPRRRRRPTWTPATAEAVRRVRARYPRWGKDKLAVLLRRAGLAVSVSMVGRILAALYRRGALLDPPAVRVTRSLRPWRRPHAVRKPPGWRVEQPGDLVELDTVHLAPAPGREARGFTARDVVSRWDVLGIAPRATAAAAAAFLAELADRIPFPLRAVQVDGGSEFMAEFEAACAARGIALYVLPPRSPRLNGAVERANRTHAEEFYELTDAPSELEALQTGLADWELCYNTIRPHQALGYLTPAEYLASLDVEV